MRKQGSSGAVRVPGVSGMQGIRRGIGMGAAAIAWNAVLRIWDFTSQALRRDPKWFRTALCSPSLVLTAPMREI